MSDWIRLTLQVPEQDQDLLITELAVLGVQGFVQEPAHVDAFVPVRSWTPRLREKVDLVCAQASRRTRRRIRLAGSVRVPHQNWNVAWERSTGIVEATPRIIIKPSWKKLRARDRGKLVLHIDPKMSFGTGHHETTRICLRFLEEFMFPRARVLDFGSGTGILAIAAVKLGARSAVGLDNDPWCFDNARENVRRNRVSKRVKIALGGSEAIPNRLFDVIVANIDLPTISKALRRLHRAVKPGGILVLSGLLVKDIVPLSGLLLRYKSLLPLALSDEGEWVGVALLRR